MADPAQSPPRIQRSGAQQRCLALSSTSTSPNSNSGPLSLDDSGGRILLHETVGDENATYISWVNIIPPPTHMVLPDESYRGTCLGHAYAECITSRRRLIAYQSGNLVSSSAVVALPQLIHEFICAKLVKKEGLLVIPVSEYVQLYGVPLEGTAERAYINGFTMVQMTEVQPGSNDGDVMNERTKLLREILQNGPVVGLIDAGPDWPEANGKVYYGHKVPIISGETKEGHSELGPHAVLIYGSSWPSADILGYIST